MIPISITVRGPAPIPTASPTASIVSPPIATAIVVDDAVTTLDRPMYRPDAAFGMMSVMSAQSTDRNVPCDDPRSAAPRVASMRFGARATSTRPSIPKAVQPQMTGFRPIRSDSRDAGMIDTRAASVAAASS
jgi:hypothetical protein